MGSFSPEPVLTMQSPLHLLLYLVTSLCAATLLTGCAATEQRDPDAVSTIPWNRPASWEGQGPMGGMMMMQQQGR